MNINIKKLLGIAYDEVGYLEKKTNEDLDDKLANAGSANYTKYARDCFPTLQGMAWCCMFVWWCFEKTFGKIMAHNLIGEKTAKCSIMQKQMIDNNSLQIDNPKQGDIVFFNNGDGINHIGIVYSVGSDYFSTIEGNTSKSSDTSSINKVVPNGGGVFVRAYSYCNYKIESFIRPRWDLLKDNEELVEPILTYNAIIKATNVNIRAGAGTDKKWVGMETKGYKFYTIGAMTDNSGKLWYKFIYKGRNAYIRSDFVELI